MGASLLRRVVAALNVSALIAIFLFATPHALGRTTLQRITVTPATASVPAGLTQQFKATGTYSDGSSRDITTSVTWSSSNTTVASIGTYTGLATAKRRGSATVTARSGTVRGSATLQVTAAILQSITVTPSSASIVVGKTQQFVATGTYSDGTKSTITNSVSWTTSNSAVASISASGLAQGISAGDVTVTASSGSVSGSATLSVAPPSLVSISVTPANPSTPLGLTIQFTATGTYSDGSTQNLTATAVWSSSATNVATIASGGLASTQAVGSTTITAASGAISGQTTLTVSPAALVSLSITPGSVSIPLGTSQQFSATGTFTDGSTQNVTTSVNWTSSLPAVATIDATGLASGKGTGSTSITATSGAITSNSALLTILPAVLQSIAVTPADISIGLGTAQQFTATGTYSDGSTQDLTSAVAWDSSFPSIATISTTGLAASVAVGTTTISATYESIVGSTTLTVSPAQLASIAITPAIPSIPLGTTQQFTATGTFTDGSTQDVTTTVHWSSSDATVATVSNGPDTNGLASSLATGMTTIAASSGAISGSTTLSVTPAILVSIAVTPANSSLAMGTKQQMVATGTYSDSTKKDLTTTAVWSSSDPSVATVDEAGVAYAVAAGQTIIGASVNGISGTTTLTVTSVVLLSITVSPSAASIPLGTTQQFSASGTYSDDSTQDITTSVHWSSSDGTVSTISNNAGTMGLASSVSVGTVTISATLGSISGTASLTVTPAELVSIAITPVNPSIALGRSQQFAATGTYTDQSSKDITTNVTWSSSSAMVAVISNNPGSQGLATSSGVGWTTITATMGSVSASTTLTVGPPQLVSITVTPANPSISLGTAQQFTATGTYTDNSTADLTHSVTWSSSMMSVATVNAGGYATSVSQGLTTITATSGAVSGNTKLTVLAPALVGLKISPTTPSIPIGSTQQFTATALYSDSSTQNVSSSATWTSSNTTVASINSAGLASGAAQGTATITTAYGGYSDFTTLTVTLPAGTAATPTFSPNSGGGSSLAVTISTSTSACNSASFIRYTMDGTTPTIASTAGTSVTLNWAGTYALKAGVFGCPGYADSSIGTSGTYTITPATLFSNGFEAGNLASDGWASCGVGGCSQDASTYVTPPNPGSLSLGNYSRQFMEPNLYHFNVLTHGLNPTFTSGTLYGRLYLNLGTNCSGSSFWLAAILSDDAPGYDTSVYIMSRPDNQLELNVITATTAYVHTTISGGLAMGHWYRVEFAVPVSTTATATVQMKVFDGDSVLPLPGGDVSLSNMITVFQGGTGDKELDIGASYVQTLCSANSPATVTMDNVGLGSSGWIGPSGAGTFTIGFFSDSHQDYTHLTSVSTAMATYNPSLVVAAGDLMTDTQIGTSWKNAMNGGSTPGNGLFNKTFAVKGNHDMVGSWTSFFNFATAASTLGATNYTTHTGTTTCGSDACYGYSFDYQNIHFVGIIGPTMGIDTMPDDLVTWLDSDLTSAEGRGLTHAILFWHPPVYWTVTDHSANPSAHLLKVLNAHPIIATNLHGHEHHEEYVRMDSSHSFTNGRITGTIWSLMSGEADDELYDFNATRILSTDWAAGYSTGGWNGFATVNVKGDSFTINYYDTSNVLHKTMTFSHSR